MKSEFTQLNFYLEDHEQQSEQKRVMPKFDVNTKTN